MHQNFGVGFAGQVEIRLGENLVPQIGVIRQLAVEGKAEPFGFFDVVPLERLGVAAVVFAAGGVAGVADGGRAGVFDHQFGNQAGMVQMEHLGDAAHVFVGVDELPAPGVKACHARGQLPPVLDVEEKLHHQAGGLVGVFKRDEGADVFAGEMIDGRNAALVKQFRHSGRLSGQG